MSKTIAILCYIMGVVALIAACCGYWWQIGCSAGFFLVGLGFSDSARIDREMERRNDPWER